MKTLFAAFLLSFGTPTVSAQYHTMVTGFIHPWFSTKIRKLSDNNTTGARDLREPSISISEPGTLSQLHKSKQTTNEALFLCRHDLPKYDLILNGISVVTTNSAKVGVIRFSRRYILFGPLECRIHRWTVTKVIRKSHRLPIQVFTY